MELSNLGEMLITFLGGNGIGAVLTSLAYYKIGENKKKKSEFLSINERIERIEERLGIK